MRKVVSILLAVAMLALPLPIAGAEVCLGCAETTVALDAAAEMQAGHGCCRGGGEATQRSEPMPGDDSSEDRGGECGCKFTCCVRTAPSAVNLRPVASPEWDAVAATPVRALNEQINSEPHLQGLKRPPRLTILV